MIHGALRVVAAPAAQVCEGLAGDRDEFPVIAGGIQRQLQDPKGRVVLHLRVGPRRSHAEPAFAARTNDEFANTADRIGHARRGLRGEALIVVLVPGDHDLRAGTVQVLPQDARTAVCQASGAEERMVQVSQDRKSTRLNSSHSQISYAVFCLKKKNNIKCLYPVATAAPCSRGSRCASAPCPSTSSLRSRSTETG